MGPRKGSRQDDWHLPEHPERGALYGTYTVDEQGRFATEHITASTFPNWTGLSRDTSRITETVDRDTMVERLKDPGGPQVVIVWKRAR